MRNCTVFTKKMNGTGSKYVMALVLLNLLLAACSHASAITWAYQEKLVDLPSLNGDCVVDSITVNGVTVDAVYNYGKKVNNPSSYNVGEYSCAGFVTKFYSQVYGISVGNLSTSASVPTVYAGEGTFYAVTSPQVGDIMRVSPVHWAIVRSVDNGVISIIQQNAWSYDRKKFILIDSVNPDLVTFFRWSLNDKPQLSLVSDGPGTITGTPADRYAAGTQITLQASPNYHANFIGWEASGVTLSNSSSASISFTMPNNAVTITAKYSVQPGAVCADWLSTSVVPGPYNSSFSSQLTVEASMLTLFSNPTNVKLHVAYEPSSIAPAIGTVLTSSIQTKYFSKTIAIGEPVASSSSLLITRKTYAFSTDMSDLRLLLLPLPVYPHTTYYYYWSCELQGETYRSEVKSFRTEDEWGSLSNLRVNDASYGIFNADLSWNTGVARLSEVGCFISTSREAVAAATPSNPGSAAVVKDTGISNNTGETTVFYKGPTFGSLGQLQPGTTYYYRFYAVASNVGYPIYSVISVYATDGTPSDTTVPTITDGRTYDISSSGYSLSVTASDDTAVSWISIGTWNDIEGISQAKWQTVNNLSSTRATAEFRISVSDFGNHENTIYHTNAYAVDAAGNFCEVVRVADVTVESVKPVVTRAWIESISPTSYQVVCEATDDTAVTKFSIGTWHDQMHVDHAVWQEMETTDGTARFNVSISDFDNVSNTTYHTNVYAFDACGNISDSVRAGDPYLDNTIPVVTAASITNVTATGYDVVVTATDNNGIKTMQLASWVEGGVNEARWLTQDCEGTECTRTFHVDISDTGLSVNDLYNIVYAWDVCGNLSEGKYAGQAFADSVAPVVEADSYLDNMDMSGFDAVIHATDNYGLFWLQLVVWHSGISINEAKYYAFECSGSDIWTSVSIDYADFGGTINEAYSIWAFVYDQFDNCSEATYLGTLYPDDTLPEVTEMLITNVTAEGYDVTVSANDNLSLSSLAIGSWYDGMPEDEEHWDMIECDGTYASGTFHVSFADFGNGNIPGDVWFYTMAFAYDRGGNFNDNTVYNQIWRIGNTRDRYAGKVEAETCYLPSNLNEIQAAAFGSVAARYFVLPESVQRIEAYAFPQAAIVYLYDAGSMEIDTNAIPGNGIFVEMTKNYSDDFARQIKDTSCQYVRRSDAVR